MSKRKLCNFIIFIPFAISIGAFILYFKYLYELKFIKHNVSKMISLTVVRYRNIGLFCLLVGVILLFIKTIYTYVKSNNEIRVRRENGLGLISNRLDEKEISYDLDEESIITDLLKDRTLKVKFYDSDIENMIVRFKDYDSSNNMLEFYDLNRTKVVKERKSFSKVKFVLNCIVILLCLILLLLCLNKINNQSKINRSNLNIKTVEK